jgi:formate dehydrogenase major subunit
VHTLVQPDAISDVFQSKSAAVDKKVRTTCSYCGVGCNLEASIKDEKVVAIDTPKETEVNAGILVLKEDMHLVFTTILTD